MTPNALEMLTTILSMSSTEIATLTGKRHDHVLRDIDKMFIDLYPDENERNLLLPKFGGRQKFEQQRETRSFNLDKDHTLCLITGYSTVARMKIIKRWQELEESNKTKLTPLEMAKMFIIAEEARLKAEKANRQLTGQVEELEETITDIVENNVLFRNSEVTERDLPTDHITIKELTRQTTCSPEVVKRVLDQVGHPKVKYTNKHYLTGEPFKEAVSYERKGALQAFYDSLLTTKTEKRFSKDGNRVYLIGHPAMSRRIISIETDKAADIGLIFNNEAEFD